MREVRTGFTPHVRVQVSFGGDVGRAKQAFRDECDINNIMRRFHKDGVLTHVARVGGQYFDAEPVDFREAMTIVLEGQERFSQLPAKVRRHFDNDPAEFLAFMQDPANVDKARELGLVQPKAPEPAPTRVEVVNPPGAESPEG